MSARLLTLIATCFAVPLLLMAPARAQSDLERIVAAKVVRMGAAESPPWYHQDLASGAWSGIGPEIAELVFGSIGVKVEYVPTTWANAAAGLQANRFEIMGAFNATPQRALAADFTVPILDEPNGVLTLKPTPQMARWADLNTPTFRFAITQGTSIAQAVQNLVPLATATALPGSDTVFMQLDSQRVDAVLGGRAQAQKYIQAHNAGTFVIPEPRIGVVVNFGVRKAPVKDLRDWLNVAIAYYDQNGAIPAIRLKYLGAR